MLIRKIKGISAVFLICIVFTIVAVHLPTRFLGVHTSSKSVRFIIDAGHGIPDGGAVAEDGTTEQELNLAIVLKLSDELNKQKIAHRLTRSNENSIYTEGDTIHAKKVSDIKQRITVANETPTIPLISIHLNSFPNRSVCGIQVFYKEGDDESKKLAEALQRAFNAQIQPENTKTIKPISKNIYLFSNIPNPSVLIECGFLSNQEDLEMLKTDEYQEQLALVISKVLAG